MHLKNTLKYTFILIAVFSLLSSCDRFNKLLKSSDYDLKLKRADEYYKKGNYIKAEQLYSELIPVFKGTEKAEEIYYYFTYCNYYIGDFGLDCASDKPIHWRYYIKKDDFDSYVAGFKKKHKFIERILFFGVGCFWFQ